MIAAPLKSLPRDFLTTLKKRLFISLLLIFFVWLLVLIYIWAAVVEDELYAVPDFTLFQVVLFF